MADALTCYRCEASLAELPRPLSRLAECPSCSAYLHVCRMCLFFDPAVPKQCREDDAEEVKDKQQANFCDWFKPSDSAFAPGFSAGEAQARDGLAKLFDDDAHDNEGENGDDDTVGEADKLFK